MRKAPFSIDRDARQLTVKVFRVADDSLYHRLASVLGEYVIAGVERMVPVAFN